MATKKRATKSTTAQTWPKGGRPLALGDPDKPITVRTDRRFRAIVEEMAAEQNWELSQVIRVCVLYVRQQGLDLREVYRELRE